MPRTSSRARAEPPIVYRDRHGRVWYASEVAQLRVVSPAIDGPNLCLVIRFERDGEERFARWIGGEGWRSQQSLDRLFGQADGALEGTRASEAVVADAIPVVDAHMAESSAGATRPPFDHMMAEIAGATSVREIDDLGLEVRREFGAHPRLADLEGALDGMRRLLLALDDAERHEQ